MNEDLCVNCGLCEKVCPVLHPFATRAPMQVLASRNQDEKERLSSSSGGVFVLLAKQIIKHGGVVFGVAFDDQWHPVHRYCETIEELAQFQGSKYVQSKIGITYIQARNFLNEGRDVLFSGTPCQIAGLKRFLRKDYSNLLTVEVICHGVPSPGVWEDYLVSIRRPKGAVAGENTVLSSLNDAPSIEGISFRDKQNGWRKYGFVVRFSADQREAEKFGLSSVKAKKNIVEYHQDNLFMRAFLKNLILRPSCFSCPAKHGRSGADMSLGDFWSIGQYLKEWNDDKGVTLVYLNTEKGQSYYRLIKCTDIALDPSVRYNKMFYESTVEKYPSEKFWMLYKQNGLKSIQPICELLKPSRSSTLLSRAFSKFKRILNIVLPKRNN